MRLTMTLLAALFVTTPLAATTTTADHSEWECPFFHPYIPSDMYQKSYPVYVSIDEVMSNDRLFEVWVYAESNGVDGLQRHDAYCQTNGWENPDTLLF